MTRTRVRRFKEALNVLIQDAQVEEAHVFMVTSSKQIRIWTKSQGVFNLLICCYFGADLL